MSFHRRRVAITCPTFTTTVRSQGISSEVDPYGGGISHCAKWEVNTEPDNENVNITAQSKPAPARNGLAIVVVNVVCNFKLCCHVNLKEVARRSLDVEYKPAQNIVVMDLHRPKCSAKIFSSGKIFATGTTSEADALKAARRIARRIQKSGHPNVKFSGFRVNNMMSTSKVPFSVRLADIAELGPPYVFEPELGNRLHVRYDDLNTSVNVSPNGNITIFANSRPKVLEGLKRIYPVLLKYRCSPAPLAPMQLPARTLSVAPFPTTTVQNLTPSTQQQQPTSTVQTASNAHLNGYQTVGSTTSSSPATHLNYNNSTHLTSTTSTTAPLLQSNTSTTMASFGDALFVRPTAAVAPLVTINEKDSANVDPLSDLDDILEAVVPATSNSVS